MIDQSELFPRITIDINVDNPAKSAVEITTGDIRVRHDFDFSPKQPIEVKPRDLEAKYMQPNVDVTNIEYLLSTGKLEGSTIVPVLSQYDTFTRGIDIVNPSNPNSTITISGLGMGVEGKDRIIFDQPSQGAESIGEYLANNGISPLQGQEFKKDGTSYQYTDHSPTGAYLLSIVDEKVDKTIAAGGFKIPAVTPSNPQGGEYTNLAFRGQQIGFVTYELPTHLNMYAVAQQSVVHTPVEEGNVSLYEGYAYKLAQAVGTLQRNGKVHTQLHVGNLELDVTQLGQNTPIIKDWGNTQDVSIFDNSTIVKGGLTARQIALATDVSMLIRSTLHAYLRATKEQGHIVDVNVAAPRIVADILEGYRHESTSQFSVGGVLDLANELHSEIEGLPVSLSVLQRIKKIADRYAIQVVKEVHPIE